MQTYASFSGASAATRLKLTMYYVQRIVTSRTIRRISHHATVGALRLLHRADGPHAYHKSSLAESLKKSGYTKLGRLLSDAQCQDMLRYLDDKTMVDARGAGGRFTLRDVPQGATLGDYPPDTIVACPHVLEIANHPDIIKLMTGYFGFKPTIVSLGLRWSFPNERPTDAVQHFHRDSEPGSVKLMIYLTDVDSLSGPHVYVEGTHHERMPVRLRTHSDDEVTRKYGTGVSIKGHAGTGFIIDTKGIHKGAAPTRSPRLLLGIQYALLPCFLYEYAPVPCRQADQYDSYINRLMIVRAPEDQGCAPGAPCESCRQPAPAG